MQRPNFIKTCLFRLLAFVLLAASIGFVLVPDYNVYSFDKTFIRSHAPTADNYLLALTSDDKEDLDEDRTVDTPVSLGLSAGLISFISFGHDFKDKAKSVDRIKINQAYIFHRQLLI